MSEAADSSKVTELLPEKRQLPLEGLYLDQKLTEISAQLRKALVLTNFLTDKNGVIARTDQQHHFQAPPETRNASDWRLSQELMAQADVIICGGSYLKRVSVPGSSHQDILHQFEPGGDFEELGDWRMQTGCKRRSPDLAVVTRHLDFKLPEGLLPGGRKVAIFTTDGIAKSEEAKAFVQAGAAVIGGGELGVDGNRMINYLQDEMHERVMVMASGPRVLELLLQAGRLELLYITQVQRKIQFDDPSTVITLLPNGKSVQDLKEFQLTHEFRQDHAVAGDGKPISQLFLRYDRRSGGGPLEA